MDTICVGGSSSLTLTGFPMDLGISYQWEESPSGQNNFSPITGATSFSYTALNIVANTDYRVAVTCNNTGGGTSHTNTVSIVVNNPQIISSLGATRCGPGTLNLTATANPGNSVNWYASAIGGSPLSNGTVFTTPVIAATDTFYAGAAASGGSADSVNVPLANGTTTGVYFHMFMVNAVNSITVSNIGIKCNQAVNTLTSWDIYYRPDNYQLVPGANTSSNGWTLLSSVTNVPSAGANAFTTIASNLSLVIPANTTYSFHIAPVGTASHQYATNAAGTTVASNADASIIAGHRGSLFNCGTASGMAVVNIGYATGCAGTRVPVVATVTTPPTYTLSANPPTICSAGSTTISVTSANNYTYSWTPTGSGSSFSVSPTTTTKYYVSGIDGNNCSILDSITINVVSPPPALTATASPDAICVSGNTSLSLTPVPMPGLTIQWEKNTGSGYTAISGATNATHIEPVTANTAYRALVYCNSNLVATSSVDTVTYSNPAVAQTFPGSRCGAGPVTLAATPANPADAIKWFTAASGGTALSTGTAYTTPSIAATTTYYAAASSGIAGPPQNLLTTTAAGNSAYGNLFDLVVTNAVRIDSFSIYAMSANTQVGVYYRTGTGVGFNTAATGWTLIGTATIGSLGSPLSVIPLFVNLNLAPGTYS
ncbi:MAG TPA: hypothetical protein PL084_13040, partial [Chitinophagales bacterium]|nr:hypothetical protein [Chitinophagales bacterium]